jgi:hypothetical protein
MPNYRGKVTETFTTEICIEASNEREAYELLKDMVDVGYAPLMDDLEFDDIYAEILGETLQEHGVSREEFERDIDG